MAPIRLGVIGSGIMGDQVARTAAALDQFVVTAIAEADPGRRVALASDLGAAMFADAGELAAAGLADAVYVGVPHHLHLAACMRATGAGLHGLMDKPLCNTDAEAGQIEAAVRESGTTWMVGFSYRFRAEWQRARELVMEGQIGDPVAVTDVIAEAAAHTPGWYWEPASGGGVLQLQAHHCFDRIAWLTGRAVREVSCQLYAPPSSAATAAHIVARLGGGAVAGISLTFGTRYAAPVRALFIVQGTEGQIEITGDRCLTVQTADGVTSADYSGDDWLSRELSAFAHAANGCEPPAPTVADGRAALRCALAADRSAVTGERVMVAA